MKPTNKPMKRLSLYLFLILFSFQTPSQADDIRDFQIEGMSIGDSLLEFVSEDKFRKKRSPNKKIKYMRTDLRNGLEIYDNIQVWWLENDTKYTIAALGGNLDFPNNMKGCKKKQKEIGEDILDSYPTLRLEKNESKNMHDKTGKSITYHFSYYFSNGDHLGVQCYDFSEYMEKTNNVIDNLKVMIVPKIFKDHYKKAKK